MVEQLSADLRMAFPDMKGFSRDNVFRMTAAARKIGVATCQTALPDETRIRARLEHFAWPREDARG